MEAHPREHDAETVYAHARVVASGGARRRLVPRERRASDADDDDARGTASWRMATTTRAIVASVSASVSARARERERDARRRGFGLGTSRRERERARDAGLASRVVGRGDARVVTRGIRDREGTEARAEETRERGGEGGSIAGAGREGARDGRERAGTRASRRQKYALARGGRASGGGGGRGGGRGERARAAEVDLRVSKSSHGALQRHVDARGGRRRDGGGRGGSNNRGGHGQTSGGGGKSTLRPGERIVRAMESIETPVRGETLEWDVVASAVNPPGAKFKFSTSTLNFAIKELGERGSFDRAHALYLWMARKRGRYAPNEFTYVSLAGAARTLSATRTVQKLWRSFVEEGKDELICNEVASAVIAALNRMSDWSGAYEVFVDMGKAGKERNLYTYTAVLTALRDEAKPDEAMLVLDEMAREPGVQPTSLAFALTLTAFDNARRWIEGNALAKRIKKYDVRPDTTLMHAVITMAGRAGDMAHANDVFTDMRNSTMIVTTYTFNALLGGYARYGDWEGCTEVYDEMKRSRIQPDSYTFTQLISAAERSGEYVAADGVWAEMLRARIIPHTVMCGAYIHCLGCQGRDLEAEAVMEKMRDFWDVPRNAAVYNALIGAHIRSGEVTRALGVLDDMQRIDGLMPTEITFAVLIRACQESALHKRAEGLEGMRNTLANAGQLVQDLSGAAP